MMSSVGNRLALPWILFCKASRKGSRSSRFPENLAGSGIFCRRRIPVAGLTGAGVTTNGFSTGIEVGTDAGVVGRVARVVVSCPIEVVRVVIWLRATESSCWRL